MMELVNMPAVWQRCDCESCVNELPPEPRTLGQTSAQALLEGHGWKRTLGGKHNVKMEKPGWRPITLPMHNRRDYSRSLKNAILRQAGLRARGGDDDE